MFLGNRAKLPNCFRVVFNSFGNRAKLPHGFRNGVVQPAPSLSPRGPPGTEKPISPCRLPIHPTRPHRHRAQSAISARHPPPHPLPHPSHTKCKVHPPKTPLETVGGRNFAHRQQAAHHGRQLHPLRKSSSPHPPRSMLMRAGGVSPRTE